MSILRMASFKASYALFLKLDSGAIRTIAISASAMFGNALVGFRSDTTNLLQWESSFTGLLTGKFLAYQIPECQAAYFLQRSKVRCSLTSWLLAYQMPSPAIFDPRRRSNLGFMPLRSATWNRARRMEKHHGQPQHGRALRTQEPRSREKPHVQFQRCRPQGA